MNPLLIRRRGMMQAAGEAEDKTLTFTALTDNSSVQLTAVGSAPALSLEYNIGGGWAPYTVGDAISLNADDTIKMRGVNTTLATSTSNYNRFVMTGSIEASGHVTSLFNNVGGDYALPNFACYGLFYGCTGLVQPPELPSTTIGSSCYQETFKGCTGLVLPPILPSTTLNTNCYNRMFIGCTGLVQPPVLPATTLKQGCYQNMLRECTGLTQGPVLPATILAPICYYNMFVNCRNIVSYDVATLNNSQTMFQNNNSCVSMTIHAVTPPAIASNTITGLKSDCIIYVPAGSVAAYQAAQYWSARAAYIQAIPNT